MSDMANDLQAIGAALSRATPEGYVDLTDRQRSALASAKLSDVLDAIWPHFMLSGPPTDMDTLRAVCDAWAAQLRSGFADTATREQIAAALKTETPTESVINVIRADGRLSPTEKQPLIDLLGADDTDAQHAEHGPSHGLRPAYIKQIAVEGFRGIGPRSELSLTPGPGLTIVYGVNGSGKSTFVDALEVLFDGRSYRFEGRGPEWQQAWFNAHTPDGGLIDIEFALVPPTPEPTILRRRWTRERFNESRGDERFDVTPTDELKRLGWTSAVHEFRPILGRAEFGPLFDEDESLQSGEESLVDRSTPLASRIRTRSGDADPMAARIDTALEKWRQAYHPLERELKAWGAVHQGVMPRYATRRSAPSTRPLRLATGVGEEQRDLPPPKYWDWPAMLELIEQPNASYRQQRRLPHLITRLITKIKSLRRGTADTRKLSSGTLPELALAYREHMSPDDSLRWQELRGSRVESRTRVYGEMLVDAIHQAGLNEFSKNVRTFWEALRYKRPLQVDSVALSQVYFGGTGGRAIRTALNLQIDGKHDVERGVLSEGEMHSLALSVFLPTLMRPESPFKFAVIDDPGQTLDEDAIDGLIDSLEEAAESLQVVVFTHDKRLLNTAEQAGVEHTHVNLIRGAHSHVHCRVVSDPVSHHIELARAEFERFVADSDASRRRRITTQCRIAIEAACARVVQRRMIEASGRPDKIPDQISRAFGGRNKTTRAWLSVAIFNDASCQNEVKKYVAENAQWGPVVDEVVRALNRYAHSSDPQNLPEGYRDDLSRLIDDAESVTKIIATHCKHSIKCPKNDGGVRV